MELPVHNLEDSITQTYKLYLTTPVLYAGLSQKYNKETLQTKLGILFESVVVSQILQILNNSTSLRVYTFRDEQLGIEYDLVIEDFNNDIVYLNEIKYSNHKYGKYKYNELIERFFSPKEIKYIDITPDTLLTVLDFYKAIITPNS